MDKNMVKKVIKGGAILIVASLAIMSLFACKPKEKVEKIEIPLEKSVNSNEHKTQDNVLVKDPDKYDKNGNPYLSKDLDYKDPSNYTFKNNGMGSPIQAPPKGKYITIKNPNTGEKWAYTSSNSWSKSNHDKAQEEVDRMQNRVMGGESNITDEQINKIMDNMVINAGGMN